MYNRYIPQSDGSYRRNRIQEPHKEPDRPVTPVPVPPPPQVHPPAREPDPSPCSNCIHKQKRPVSGPRNTSHQGGGIGHFLKQLLPKDLDTEDLLVILLLLIMAGDCQEDQNTALLTLALYLFL